MAGGWCYVKELRQPQYAAEFVRRGFAALIFDYRYLGASDGEPRQHLDPWKQIEDYRNAISYLETRPDIDSDRVGVWGISYSGGHVLILWRDRPAREGHRQQRARHRRLPDDVARARHRSLPQAAGAVPGGPAQAARDRRRRHPADVRDPSGPDAELVAWPLERSRWSSRN